MADLWQATGIRRLVTSMLGLGVSVVGFCVACSAQQRFIDDHDELIHKVLEASGAKQYFQNVFVGVQAHLRDAQTKKELPGTYTAAKLYQVASEIFDPEVQYQYLVAGLKREFDEEKLQAVLTWLNSPLGKKVVQSVAEASTYEAERAQKEFAIRLEHTALPLQRIQLIQRLFTDDRMATRIQSMLISTRGWYRMALVAHNPEYRVNPDVFEPFPSESKLLHFGEEETTEHVRALFAYRTLSDDELSQAVQYYEFDAGKWFDQVRDKAITQGFADAFARGIRLLQGVTD